MLWIWYAVNIPTCVIPQMILVRLYKEGPSVPGVFRRSCNARLARELKDSLNGGVDAAIDGADILVLATVMKVSYYACMQVNEVVMTFSVLF
jgi:hypothetical protein